MRLRIRPGLEHQRGIDLVVDDAVNLEDAPAKVPSFLTDSALQTLHRRVASKRGIMVIITHFESGAL